MSRLSIGFLLVLLLKTWAGNEPVPPQPPAPDRGEWLARQVRHRDQGRDARVALRMQLFDRQGRRRERSLTVLTLRGGAGRPVPGDRTLVRFTAPADIQGTGLLVWEHPGADDERFLYLPALGRVRRIAASESQDSFAGSDFTYEDIGGRPVEDYTYQLRRDATGAETTAWTAPDGARHPVYTLESRSRQAGVRFPRIISLVRADIFVVVRAEIHNRRDEAQRTFEVARIEKVDGYWTAMAMTMADAIDRTRTALDVVTVEYDIGLTEDAVSRRALERGGGH